MWSKFKFQVASYSRFQACRAARPFLFRNLRGDCYSLSHLLSSIIIRRDSFRFQRRRGESRARGFEIKIFVDKCISDVLTFLFLHSFSLSLSLPLSLSLIVLGHRELEKRNASHYLTCRCAFKLLASPSLSLSLFFSRERRISVSVTRRR